MKSKIICILIISIFLGSAIIPATSSISTYEVTSLNDNTRCYGFIISVNENQSYEIQTLTSRAINDLLEINSAIYWTAETYSIYSKDLEDTNNKTRIFEKGSFLIPFTNNSEVDDEIIQFAYDYNYSQNLEIYKIAEELNQIKSYKLNIPKIVYYAQHSVDCWNYFHFLHRGGFKHHTFANRDDILQRELPEDINVIVFGGDIGIPFMEYFDYVNPLTGLAYKKINNLVKEGCGYVGSCLGATMAATNSVHPKELPWDYVYLFEKITPRYARINMIDRPTYRALPGAIGGRIEKDTGIKVRITDRQNPVSYGLPEIIENHDYLGGDMFLEKKFGESNTKSLAVIEEVNKSNMNLTWHMDLCPFYRNKLIPREKREAMVDDWINYSIGKDIWVTAKYGQGKIVAFGGHPEFIVAKDPPRIVYNSIFYVTSDTQDYISITKSKQIDQDTIANFISSFNQISEDIVTVNSVNNPPSKPSIRVMSEYDIGEPGFCIGETFLFCYNSTDPENDDVWYIIDYDGIVFNFTRVTYKSNETAILWEICFVEEVKEYKVKAVDSKGSESPWSDTLTVEVKKGRLALNPILGFMRFLSKHPNLFPFIREFFYL